MINEIPKQFLLLFCDMPHHSLRKGLTRFILSINSSGNYWLQPMFSKTFLYSLILQIYYTFHAKLGEIQKCRVLFKPLDLSVLWTYVLRESTFLD